MELSGTPSSERGATFATDVPVPCPDRRFQRYTPGLSPYSKRRTDEEWESHRKLLTQMHEQLFTRRQMLEVLKDRDFTVTSGQLFAQLKKWDLMVYAPGKRGKPNSKCDVEILPGAGRDMITYQPELFNDFQLLTLPRLVIDEGPIAFECHEDPLPDTQLSAEHFLRADSQYIIESMLSDSSDEEQEKKLGNATADSGQTDETAEDDYVLKAEIPEAVGVENDVLPGNVAGNDSLLQQLPLVMEPWCQPFPNTCCCHSFFEGIEGFATSPQLYHAILLQSSPSSLAYILALLKLVEDHPQKISVLCLKEPLWLTIKFYIEMCTRPNHKNSLARSILYALLKAWGSLGEEQISVPTKIFTNRQAESRGSLFARAFRARLSRKVERSASVHFDWELSSERDITTLVGISEKGPSLFPLVNWSGQSFGNPAAWSTPTGDPEPQSLSLSVRTFAKILERNWVEWQLKFNLSALPVAQIIRLNGCDWSLIIRSLGVMLALELDVYAINLLKLDGQLADSAIWPTELERFVSTMINTLDLNAEYAEKFRKSYWLASTEKIGHNGKGIHTGPCKAKAEWRVLECDIREYDEERTWIERRLFSGSGSWPQAGDLIMSDCASIKSGSSIDSFRRFQALAFHLKIGSPHSWSIRSKSTQSIQTKMSLDSHLSWQLEHMLGLEEEAEGTEEVDLPKPNNEVKLNTEAGDALPGAICIADESIPCQNLEDVGPR